MIIQGYLLRFDARIFTALAGNMLKMYHFITNGPDCSAGNRQVKFGKTPCQAWPCNFHVSLSGWYVDKLVIR